MKKMRFSIFFAMTLASCLAVCAGFFAFGQNGSDSAAAPSATADERQTTPDSGQTPDVAPDKEEGEDTMTPQKDLNKAGQFFPDHEYLRKFSHVDPNLRMKRLSKKKLEAARVYNPSLALQEEHDRFMNMEKSMAATTSTLPNQVPDQSESVYSPRPANRPSQLFAPPAPLRNDRF
jgi:hypothetical protein